MSPQGEEGPSHADARRTVERLVGAYADLVVRLSYARLGSTHDAQDVCQTVFLKLLKLSDAGLASFADAEHEKAWVIRATVNACTDLQRSGWRTKVGSLDDPAEELAPPSDAAARWDPLPGSTVLDAVNELPPNYRTAIYLRYYEGYSTEEIARLTGDTPDTVRKHLSRGRAKLRDALEGEGV